MLYALAFATALAATAMPVDFQQGPERIGQERSLNGTVLSLRGECALFLGRDSTPGRFMVCFPSQDAPGLSLGQAWNGVGIQTATTRVRAGSHWRVIPVYRPS